MAIDEKRLAELAALASGADHLELLLDERTEHVFISVMRREPTEEEALAASGLPKRRREDWNVNANTVGLLRASRSAVPALVEEVRRLRVVIGVMEAHAAEAARALQASSNRSIAARAAERERCAKYIEAKCYSGGAPCCCELQAMFMRELPDEPSPEET